MNSSGCVCLPALDTFWVRTHTSYVKHARAALEGVCTVSCYHSGRSALTWLRLMRAARLALPAVCRLRLWGLQLELAEELETASARSQPESAGSSALAQDPEARSVASSAPSESLILGLSSSEE